MTEALPMLVEPGWERSVMVGNVAGPIYRLLFYPDGAVRFEHQCDRPRISTICAPALRLDGGHRITQADPVTVEPSILCPDCGTHGFVRDGRWVPA